MAALQFVNRRLPSARKDISSALLVVGLALVTGCDSGSRHQPPKPKTTAPKSSIRPTDGPTLLSVNYVDPNQNNQVDKGDLLKLKFSEPIQLARKITAKDFGLPVPGDSLGQNALVTQSAPDELTIELGDQAKLSPAGVFGGTVFFPGSPSGIDIIASSGIESVKGKSALPYQPADIATGPLTAPPSTLPPTPTPGAPVTLVPNPSTPAPGPTTPPTLPQTPTTPPATPPGTTTPPATPTPAGPAPKVKKVSFYDINNSSRIDKGDTLTVTFDASITVKTGWNGIKAKDFNLPVGGDSLGKDPSFQAGVMGDDIVIKLGKDASLTLKGSFDATQVTPGSASGLDIAAAVKAGMIADAKSNVDAQASLAKDIEGVVTPPDPPMLNEALLLDLNLSGKADEGDELQLVFNKNITLGAGQAAPVAADFALKAGDSLGQNPVLGPMGQDGLRLTLGVGALLTLPGASVDIAATIGKGHIIDEKLFEAAPGKAPLAIAQPSEVLDITFKDQTHLDAAATTAEWNQGQSETLAGSLSRFYQPQGTEELRIEKDVVIDTDLGKIDGQASKAFQGAGRFVFKNLGLAPGATVTVKGRAALHLLAEDSLTLAGAIVARGAKGEDQDNWGAKSAAGGEATAGGFAGGRGSDGGYLRAGSGAGPSGGQGGGSGEFPGGGAGGGAGQAGQNGETDADSTEAHESGGQGGAILSDTLLLPLVGGSGGGGAGAGDVGNDPGVADPDDSGGAGGGAGGGAVLLYAGNLLTVSGKIDVTGGDGGSGGYDVAGAGGGAGGSILMQSPQRVDVKTSAQLLALGGKGGKGTVKGGDGAVGLVRAEDADGLVPIEPSALTGLVSPKPLEAQSQNVGAGQGTADLSIAKTSIQTSIIDTDAGTLDGQPLAGWTAAGELQIRDLKIAAGARLGLKGKRPFVVKAAGKVEIDGEIDLSGAAGEAASGLDGGMGGMGVAGGADGGRGASLTLDAAGNISSSVSATAGSGAGAGGAAGNDSYSLSGGGGASYGSAGTKGVGSSGGAAGAIYGDALKTLLAGAGGGGGGAKTGSEKGGGAGAGAGGGAFRLIAAQDVQIRGAILADGGPGGSSVRGGDGGGGSGGAMHITSAGRIYVAGRLSAVGGGSPKNGGFGGQGLILLEDRVGSFVVGSVIPPLTVGSYSLSAASSTYYAVQAPKPQYLARIWLFTEPAGTALDLEFSGADADAQGQADPATDTGWTTDLGKLAGKRFIRLRAWFKSDLKGAQAAGLKRVALPIR